MCIRRWLERRVPLHSPGLQRLDRAVEQLEAIQRLQITDKHFNIYPAHGGQTVGPGGTTGRPADEMEDG